MELARIAQAIRGYRQVTPGKDFLVYYGKDGKRTSFSYSLFLDRIGQICRFMENAGIGKGDRILTVMYNQPEQVMIYFAAWARGACVVPVNVTEDDQRIGFILSHSGAKAAFVHRTELERVGRLLPGLQHQPQIIEVAIAGKGLAEAFDVPAGSWDPLITGEAEDEALIVYTSGTTGNPKGVLLLQRNLVKDAEAIAEWHEMNEQTRLMCVLPIHHVNGTVVTLVTPLLAGGTVVLNEKFSATHFWQRVSKEQIDIVSVVPTLLEFLLEADDDISACDLSQFRHFICGAGPLLVETAIKFEAKFNKPIIHGYGLSETTCYSCFLPVNLSGEERRMWLSKYGFPSIGVPIKYNEMAILDPHGVEVKEFERGEIAIRGETVMKEYDRRPDANAEAFRHGYGWFMSGDEGFYVKDASGRKYFFITGRMKELIIRGGVNLSPLEIDEVLRLNEKIQYALCVPFENRFYGEEIAAYVVPKSGQALTEDEIIAHCARHLPFGKQPKVIIFGEDVPYTSTGKPKRIQLKEQLKEHLERYRDVQFRAAGNKG